jgi:DNA repair exonuclease SbcCD ATPase subunit
MKNIIFNKVKIQNFLSVGNEPVIINFKTGLHIITGVNKDKEDRRNGVGKSTIADAVYFAVFGETLRDVKKEHIVNSTTKKGCAVELEIQVRNHTETVDIKIVRTIEPSKCYIYINGEDKTLDSISSTNNYIRTLLSCTPEIFQNCVIMTINNTVPFMAKKKQEKREFIENIFNLSIFSEALVYLKSDLSEKRKTYEIELAKYEENDRSLKRQEKQHHELSIERERKKTLLEERKKTNITDISKLQKAAEDMIIESTEIIQKSVEDLSSGIQKIDNIVQELTQKRAEHGASVQQINKQLKQIGTNEYNCPVCLRTIDSHDKQHIEDEKQKLKILITEHVQGVESYDKQIADYRLKRNKIESKISELKTNIHKTELKLQEKKNLSARIKQLTEILLTIDNDIKEINNTFSGIDINLDEQREDLKRIQNNNIILKNELTVIEAAKFVFSEEGVKSIVIKKILQLFNNKLAYYLKKMDANCTCTFNEYFEEEIKDIKGKLCSYFNFSGAERKNIDLACLFTFMDMRRLQGDVCFNFSIYDELFDSSLDERGVELVIGIINERVEQFKECIMVISHRKESIKAATGDVIFLEKKNNLTRRVDFTSITT